MNVTDIGRTKSWKLPVALALAMGAALLLSFWSGGHHRAQATSAGATDLALAIDVNNDGTDDCDTRPSTGLGSTCNVLTGSMFTVRGYLDKLANDLPGSGGYIVFQFTFGYTSPGLTRNNRVSPAKEVGNPTYWQVTPAVPAVCAPNTETDGAGSYYVDCWQSTKSMYQGKLVEVDFTCSSTVGVRTITMQDAGTYLHDQNHGAVPDVDPLEESLTINCASGVGGIAAVPDVGAAPLQAGDSAGLSAGLLAGGIGGAAAVVVALGGAAWYARRRWAR